MIALTTAYGLSREPFAQDIPIKDLYPLPGLEAFIQRFDYAIAQRKKGEQFHCDLMLEPDVKKYGTLAIDEKSIQEMYEEGRRCATAAVPAIRKLLES